MKNFKFVGLVISILLVLAVGAVLINRQKPSTAAPSQSALENEQKKVTGVTVIAENLEVPWALAFLPDGRLLITERPGRIRMMDKEGKLLAEPVAKVEKVAAYGEGGLMGMAIHPDFENKPYVYIYYTYSTDKNITLNRVSRLKFEDNQLKDEEFIVDVIPGATFHIGGRIKFGPDNLLYITTGDAKEPSLAQNKNSLAGKILRVTDQGKAASGNPFGTLVYSYGHRNPQGIAWFEGKLWETEHGPTHELGCCRDEINFIEVGKNYGWPIILGDTKQVGMQVPALHSGVDETWAPAGAAVLGDSMFFAGLKGTALYEAALKTSPIILKEHFKEEFGRLREVVLGPDGYLYVTTSNRDGRGKPQSGDDKILKIDPSILN